MKTLRILLLWLAGAAPVASLLGQAGRVTTSGSLTVGAGAALQEGDRAAFQRDLQHRKDGFGGIESLQVIRETRDSILTFDLRLMARDADYKAGVRYEKMEAFYVESGFERFRVFYDGSGGYFRPTNTVFALYDEELYVDRSQLWFEAGTLSEDKPRLTLRYEHRERDGRKDSTHWGDTNLVGAPYGTRNVVPTFWQLDERRDIVTLDAGRETEERSWKVGGRYERTEQNNARNSRRRPFESADRVVTSKDVVTSDLFVAHGYYEQTFNPRLRFSTGGLVTTLDTNLGGGSRIYGLTYDPVYDSAYVRRQARDEGFFGLTGGAQLKQTVANLNFVYEPAKHWSIRPSLRFENLRQEAISEFTETLVSTTLVTTEEEVEAFSDRGWSEFAEEVEVRYTGRPNWTFSLRGEWVQGTGDVSEERLIVHTHALTIDRDTDYKRSAQKYALKANWYVRPGLSLSGEYYYKLKMNDYDAVRDSTNNAVPSGDRYPAYITDQDFELHDFNVRLSWRPKALLSFVTRYDYQTSVVNSVEAGLNKVESSNIESHIVSQSVTWNPVPALYLTGSVNVTFDQLSTPAYRFVQHGDNNYVNGSLGVGYALGKVTDLYADYSYYRADNFIDNSALSIPFGADARQEVASFTWVRRQSERLIYTIKYGYATNRDGTTAGLNDYDAQMIYAKVQHLF